MRLRSVGAFLAVLVVLALPLGAQERFGGLNVVVTDDSHAAVPGATVTVTNKQSGAVRSGVSGSDGVFQIPQLDPGRYSVTVELQGFQKVAADDALVLLGKTFSFTAQLKVGAVSET